MKLVLRSGVTVGPAWLHMLSEGWMDIQRHPSKSIEL